MIKVRPLTRKEREILTFVEKGKMNREIAVILGISEYAVARRMNGIFKKLHVNRRMEAVRKAKEQ